MKTKVSDGGHRTGLRRAWQDDRTRAGAPGKLRDSIRYLLGSAVDDSVGGLGNGTVLPGQQVRHTLLPFGRHDHVPGTTDDESGHKDGEELGLRCVGQRGPEHSQDMVRVPEIIKYGDQNHPQGLPEGVAH